MFYPAVTFELAVWESTFERLLVGVLSEQNRGRRWRAGGRGLYLF